MNRLASKPWFFAGVGAYGYLTGMNDELLHLLGGWWLDLGRWGQTAAVLAVLTLAGHFTQRALNRRRDAFRAAVRAAELTRPRTRPRPAETNLTTRQGSS